MPTRYAMRSSQSTPEPGETALVLAEPAAPAVSLGTLTAATPDELLTGAAAIAKPLAAVIEGQKLYSNISGRRYVRVEGWTTLGAMLGVVAREVENVERDGVYVARVQLVRLGDGQVISEASAECGADEPIWQKRPAFARRSMAATRATGKACRLAFSWVMTMAGFEATPAEEMDHVEQAANGATVVVPPETRPRERTSTAGADGEPPLQVVRVEPRAVPKKDGTEGTVYRVHFSDGIFADTWSETIAEDAVHAKTAQTPVARTVEEPANPRHVRKLKALTSLGDPF